MLNIKAIMSNSTLKSILTYLILTIGGSISVIVFIFKLLALKIFTTFPMFEEIMQRQDENNLDFEFNASDVRSMGYKINESHDNT